MGANLLFFMLFAVLARSAPTSNTTCAVDPDYLKEVVEGVSAVLWIPCGIAIVAGIRFLYSDQGRAMVHHAMGYCRVAWYHPFELTWTGIRFVVGAGPTPQPMNHLPITYQVEMQPVGNVVPTPGRRQDTEDTVQSERDVADEIRQIFIPPRLLTPVSGCWPNSPRPAGSASDLDGTSVEPPVQAMLEIPVVPATDPLMTEPRSLWWQIRMPVLVVQRFRRHGTHPDSGEEPGTQPEMQNDIAPFGQSSVVESSTAVLIKRSGTTIEADDQDEHAPPPSRHTSN